MKRIITILFFVLIFVLSTKSISAHQFFQSGTLSAIMHIEPYDIPKQGDKSVIEFFFTDTAKQFKIENCECKLEIFVNNKTTYTGKLEKDDASPNKGIASYNFPVDTNLYSIQMIATSKDSSFKNFVIKFDRVKASQAPNIFADILGFLNIKIVALILLITLGLTYLIIRRVNLLTLLQEQES